MRRLLKSAMLLAALTAAGVVTMRGLFRSSRRSLAAARLVEACHAGAGEVGARPRWGKIAVLLAMLATGGFLVVASGIVPIKASSGHWPIIAWFLHFAMQRSVATHTMGLQAPALDDPGLVLQGAGHYETGCSPCHGSPNLSVPRIPQRMTPYPPYLPPLISNWEPAELFYIVKHGVKFTGMPAWPAQQRDDEVWAMVAFLLTLPDLDAPEYLQLIYGDTPAHGADASVHNPLQSEQVPRAVSVSCGRCHGVDGRGRGAGAFPKLAGQRPDYLYAALQAYARGQRHSGVMEPVAAALPPVEMRQLALYYGHLQAPAAPPPPQEIAQAITRGQAIASQGIPRQRVPSCVDCHGPGAARRNPLYPLLAGQYASYLVLQLELFKKGLRGGSSYAHLMRPVATRLTSEQMRDVALYYESLAPTLNGPEW